MNDLSLLTEDKGGKTANVAMKHVRKSAAAQQFLPKETHWCRLGLRMFLKCWGSSKNFIQTLTKFKCPLEILLSPSACLNLLVFLITSELCPQRFKCLRQKQTWLWNIWFCLTSLQWKNESLWQQYYIQKALLCVSCSDVLMVLDFPELCKYPWLCFRLFQFIWFL